MTSTWPSNVEIQCTFTIIQYCIIYMIWRLALLFIPRPEHSRPRPKTQGQGQGLRIPRSRPRPRNLALRPRPRINIPGEVPHHVCIEDELVLSVCEGRSSRWSSGERSSCRSSGNQRWVWERPRRSHSGSGCCHLGTQYSEAGRHHRSPSYEGTQCQTLLHVEFSLLIYTTHFPVTTQE